MEEMHKAIKELHNGTSSGTSDVPPEFIKMMSPALQDLTLAWLNFCWSEKRMPEENDISRSILLHKKGSTFILQNYRTLTVGCNICKILMRILYNRLERAIENADILGPSQAGFRKGMRTTDNLAILQ